MPSPAVQRVRRRIRLQGRQGLGQRARRVGVVGMAGFVRRTGVEDPLKRFVNLGHVGPAGGRRRRDAVQDDRFDDFRVCAQQVLPQQRAVGFAVVDDLVVAQRLAEGVDVGRVLDRVVGRQVDALGRKVVQAGLHGLLGPGQLLLGAPPVLGGFQRHIVVGRAAQFGLGLGRAALGEEDPVAVGQDRGVRLQEGAAAACRGGALQPGAARATGADDHGRSRVCRRSTARAPRQAESSCPCPRRGFPAR